MSNTAACGTQNMEKKKTKKEKKDWLIQASSWVFLHFTQTDGKK